MSDTMSKVHEIRREWQTQRSKMYLVCQKINELEEELAQAKASKRAIQRELTSLEVQEKELLSEVKYLGPAKAASKMKLAKAVTSSVKESFSHLTQGEKEELVKSLLGDLLK